MSQVVVVVGGGALSPLACDRIDPQHVAMIAADSGLDDALEAGLTPTHLVGDLDSVSAAGKMWAYANRVDIAEHPADKDQTDTELALVAADDTGADRLLVVGGRGDRVDHELGVLGALGLPERASYMSVTAVIGTATFHVVHAGRSCVLTKPAATTFSLLTLHGPCSGVTVTGARWPLASASLPAGTTRGISNESTDEPWITTGSGVLTVVVP